jgi:hypothetical protein
MAEQRKKKGGPTTSMGFIGRRKWPQGDTWLGADTLKQELVTAGTPGRWPKAAGDELEVAPCGWNPI